MADPRRGRGPGQQAQRRDQQEEEPAGLTEAPIVCRPVCAAAAPRGRPPVMAASRA